MKCKYSYTPIIDKDNILCINPDCGYIFYKPTDHALSRCYMCFYCQECKIYINDTYCDECGTWYRNGHREDCKYKYIEGRKHTNVNGKYNCNGDSW